MDTASILAIALGSGTIGAGIMKIIDRFIEHGLQRKDKKQDSAIIDMKEIASCVANHGDRIKGLEEDKARKDIIEQAQLKALNALLLHAMTGNATGKMRDAQEALMDSIVDNK